jgi:hypothetical protein
MILKKVSGKMKKIVRVKGLSKWKISCGMIIMGQTQPFYVANEMIYS